MEINQLPKWDPSAAGLSCCPKFDPAQWDGLELHFRDKPFVRAQTRDFFHIPLNMRGIHKRTLKAIQRVRADDYEYVVLSDDSAKWQGEHFFNVKEEVPGADNVKLTGDYITHVFEGPYRDVPKWAAEMEKLVQGRHKRMTKLYFYYTACPKCAKRLGKNYVVGIAQVGP